MTDAHASLWSLTRGERLRYSGTVLALGLSSSLMFAAPQLAKTALDVIERGDLSQIPAWLSAPAQRLGIPITRSLRDFLIVCGALSVASAALSGMFLYLNGLLAARASEAITQRLRDELFRRLQRLQASFYDTADTGDLVQRCSSDVETVRTFLAADVVEIGRALLLLVCVTPILFWMDVTLAWIALALMPVISAFALIFFRKVKQQFEAADVAEAELTGVLQENLTGVRVVRAFARQAHENERFGARNAVFRDLSARLARLMGVYWGASDFVCVTQFGLVLVFGAQRVLHGDISLGTLFAFITYETMVTWPVRQIGRVLTDSGKAVVSLQRLREILSALEESSEPSPENERTAGAISFEHVSFGYNEHEPVLHDIDVQIRAGETLAIIGAPGSGKTTLVRLLLRLYSPQAGTIRVDGREISELSRAWLRRQIGVVMQDPFLYSRTIRENLRVGRSDATEAMLTHAARDAALHSAIERFEHGYDTLIGERGVTLSGG
ncbi:MAG TPA: ABC transporter transmembrane domain-containing protein, partial [Polyangiales bacterium]|nr:ABC transporter transmembrane domain-containing protein [Polyangiales bacterium]